MASEEEQLRARIGAALGRRRDELRMTQEEAAHRCRISSRYWRDLEGGKKAGRLEVVQKILRGLGWTWHDLADHLSPSPAAQDQAIHRLLEVAWERADPRGREVLTGILQTFATSYHKTRAATAQAAEPKGTYRGPRRLPPKRPT